MRRPVVWSFSGAILIILSQLLHRCESHGMLTDPPARNCMWRSGFNNPVNYNDNELYCGGFSVQWVQNKGKCGVCGDRFNDPQPRDHESGGKFGNGIIARRYVMGQTIDVEVEIHANHWGYFELKLCPTDSRRNIVTQDCFDRHPLVLSENPRSHQYYLPQNTTKGYQGGEHAVELYRYKVNLPYGLTCSQCVMQWTYYTGNTWGICDNGTEAVGCGDQEMFRNCADVQINSVVGAFPPNALVNPPHLPIRVVYFGLQAEAPLVVTARVCLATDKFKSIPGMNDKCQKSCLSYPPNCPQEECYCISHCEATGRLAGQEGTATFCNRNCLRYPPNCPEDLCKCYKAETLTKGSAGGTKQYQPEATLQFQPIVPILYGK